MKNVRHWNSFLFIITALISIYSGCRNAMAYPSGSFDFQYDSAKFLAKRVNSYEESILMGYKKNRGLIFTMQTLLQTSFLPCLRF